jgi:hypothetical protein
MTKRKVKILRIVFVVITAIIVLPIWYFLKGLQRFAWFILSGDRTEDWLNFWAKIANKILPWEEKWLKT